MSPRGVYPRSPASERFWSQVDVRGPDECWPWRAGVGDDGYGNFWFEGTTVRAHRFAYQDRVGPIPDGLTIDHVAARGCTMITCCNPAHLEPVTTQTNTRRGSRATKTECVRGHPLTGENLYIYRGRRACRECQRERSREWKRRRPT